MSKEPTETKADADADVLKDVIDDPFSTPQPTATFFGSMHERCEAALEHIVDGLVFLEVLASRRDEEEAEEKKHREQVPENLIDNKGRLYVVNFFLLL
jgi:hypothetical protein